MTELLLIDKKKNIEIGDKFGRLTVRCEHHERTEGGGRQYICMCDCQAMRMVAGSHLKTGHTKSCGCLNREIHRKRNLKHGMINTPEYYVWANIKNRCCNPSNSSYPQYGGRGIEMCTEWKNSFEAFLADMGERPSSKHSIDRIDNSKGYSKDNCRWATRTEQNNNKRDNRIIFYKGREQTLAQWCRELGLNYKKVYERITGYHWAIEKAFEEP